MVTRPEINASAVGAVRRARPVAAVGRRWTVDRNVAAGRAHRVGGSVSPD